MIATYAYVNPVVAFVPRPAIVLGEAIEPRTLLAGAVIVFAVALIVTARGRAAEDRSGHRGDRRGDHRGGQPDAAPD